jgi:hypothetical protein
MHMLLLVGISVGFALSVLTSNNFYAEKSFTSSVNHVVCNEMKSDSCNNLIARASDLPWNGWQSYNGGEKQRFFNGIFNTFYNLFKRLF